MSIDDRSLVVTSPASLVIVAAFSIQEIMHIAKHRDKKIVFMRLI